MKLSKYFLVGTTVLFLASCGGYTEDQAKAAEEFCECMDKEGDFDILFYECDMQLMSNYDPEVFADEAWGLALDEKCPSVAGQIADGE